MMIQSQIEVIFLLTFYSTHIVSDLENIADRIIFIHKGKLIFTKNKSEFSKEESIENVMLNYIKEGENK